MINYTYNKNYLMKDNEPWFPIMGEIHYSRVPRRHWRQSLQRMKSMGVDVVSTYVFWNHHEEIRGVYEFEDNKNLREFVIEVKKTGLKLFLRIGPWSHGEARYGGLPDWVINADFKERTNDEAYLYQVEKYYQKIYTQVKGLFHKDGGPIIGVQIENEYGHAGGLSGESGEEHMRRLTQMAKRIGYEVPYYTATGWGGAVTGGLIPVMGGYCEAPWDHRLTQIEPSVNYLIRHERNDHNIGSDYGLGHGITFDMNLFPYLTAELGGGLQVTHHRRPIATGSDIAAMSIAKIGSGISLLGYYMFHGGTNPIGKLSSLQETRSTGYPNDYPVLNYDFQGPIGQYGVISEVGREIKCLAYFLNCYGQQLCEMPAWIPNSNPQHASNTDALRWSVRHNGRCGFLFVNNYQKGEPLTEHLSVNLSVSLEEETILFPTMHIRSGDFFFYPFNLSVGQGLIKYITATPLTRSKKYGWYFFYSNYPSEVEMVFEGKVNEEKLIVLNHNEALNSWLCDDVLYVLDQGNSSIIMEENEVVLYHRTDTKVRSYKENIEEISYTCPDEMKTSVSVNQIDRGTYILDLTYPKTVHDVFLRLKYVGDEARVFNENALVADQYYYGEVWEVSLEAIGYPQKLTLEITPLKEADPVYFEKKPEFKDGLACQLYESKLQLSHRTIIGG